MKNPIFASDMNNRSLTYQLNEYFPDGTPTPRTLGEEAQPYKYNGNEWVRFNGADMYDFNARQYQSTLLRFCSIDPLAEKYYNINPYAYCGGNPVKYSDPKGMEIVVGTWYGRILAKFGVNNYEATVIKQLKTLNEIDPELSKMISTLEKSPTVYKIKPTSENPNKKHIGENGYNNKSNTAYYDPENKIGYDGKERPSEAALAHELGHAENDENGKDVKHDKTAALSGNTKEQDKMNRNEMNSINKENIVREHFGYEERPYNYFDNGK